MKKTILLFMLLSFYSCESSVTVSNQTNKQNGTVVTDPGALGGQDVKGLLLDQILGKQGYCNASTDFPGKFIQGYITREFDNGDQLLTLNLYSYTSCGQSGTGTTVHIASVNYIVNKIVFIGSNTFTMEMKLLSIINHVPGDLDQYAMIAEVNPDLMSNLQSMVGENVYWNIELDSSLLFQNEMKYPSLQDISKPSSAEAPLEATEEYQYPAAQA